MVFTEEQREEFNNISKKMIKFLNENTHPHVNVIITATHAELSEGVVAINTHEFVKD